MIVRIGLVVSVSLAAYGLAQLRSKAINRSKAAQELQNLEERRHRNAEIKKEICSCTKVDSTQENDREKVKRVDSISPSLSGKSLPDEEQFLLPEFDDLLTDENHEMHFSSKDVDSSKTVQYCGEATQATMIYSDSMMEQNIQMQEQEMANNAAEIEKLRSIVQELQRREEDYKCELLEFYCLKQQETNILELQKRLKLNAVEIEMLNLKINSLEDQKKKVEEEVAESSLLKKELDSARENIKELHRQLHIESVEPKRQLFLLRQKVGLLQNKEQESSEKCLEMENKLQAQKGLEVEVVELRRANKELQCEKRELMIKLEMSEAKIASLSKPNETEMIEKAREEVSLLRHENQNLLKQIEGLQSNRFSEVEELVYLRWINACLRYELRNYKAPSGKVTARDLNKTLSPRSQENAKQLMFDYAGPDLFPMHGRDSTDIDFDILSSQASTPSDSGDFDGSSLESGSSKQTKSKKSKFIQKLKTWGKSRDESMLISRRSMGDKTGYNTMTRQKSPRHRHSMSSNPLSEVLTSRYSSYGGSIDSFREEDGKNRRARSKSSTFVDERDVTSLLLDSSEREKWNASETLVDSFERENWNASETSLEMKDSLNPMVASFRIMSKSAVDMHGGEHPASKDRHWLALQREFAIKQKAEQARNIKFYEKMKTESCTDKVTPEKLAGPKTQETSKFKDCPTDPRNENPIKQAEMSKMKHAEVQKRSPRTAKPPPKPSTGSPIHTSVSLKTSSLVFQSSTPPPPPPPPNGLHKLEGQTGEKVHRTSQVVDFYQALMKREAQKEVTNAKSAAPSNIADARHNMIGELENRSAYLLAVKADVETQGDFVKSLANEVHGAAYVNIKDVVDFVHWLDEELSFLVDELAVLKHFDWPESKVDALREAAFEYENLQKLESEVTSFIDDSTLSCDKALGRMYPLLELVEKNVYGLLRTRDMVIARYKDFNIPTYWLLDSGLVGKIKFACVQLAQKYMKRVTSELDVTVNIPEKELHREFLLVQGVRFAFRVHQFAGGFDEASMHAFEDLRSRAEQVVKDAK